MYVVGFFLLSVSGPEFFLDDFLGCFRMVRGLERLVYTDQRFLERVVAGRVDHLLLDFGRVRAPAQQKQFLLFGALGCALALVRVLEIKQTVTAFLRAGLLQVFQEQVVSRIALADHFDVDLLFVFDVEHHVPMLLVLLDLFVNLFARIRHGHSRCHFRAECAFVKTLRLLRSRTQRKRPNVVGR